MTRFPALTARALEKVLLGIGFEAVRRRGSHVFYRHPDGRTTAVPHHAGRELARPLIREILREVDMSPEELQRLVVR
ncbi:MAG: type II toxin-antitoxin system HicA family toxin [Armatimonadetes bacterium]|nr:type II toxin-antitoxin system HicA family toxin [Armatimonadota bacterium]